MNRRLAALLLVPLAALASPDEKERERAPNPPPRILIEEIAGGGAGILANLRVDYAPACSKEDALIRGRCNSVRIQGSDVQVLLNGPQGRVRSAVGLHNPETVDDDRLARGQGLDLFSGEAPLIDLDGLRAAADRLSDRLPGRTGTLTWPQFQANVRAGRPMYGVVRVLVPVSAEADDEDDDHRGTRQRSRSGRCGDGLWDEDEHRGPQARIEVYGSLLFDFVDCRSGRLLDGPRLPPRSRKIKIPVPLLVNPARPRADGALEGLDRLAALAAPGLCRPTPCTVDLEPATPFAWVPESSRRHFHLATGAPLTEAAFAALPAAARLHLLMPSGYVDGWLTAFRALGLDQGDWRDLGFATRDPDGPFDAAAVLDEAFQDLPALAYAGGLVDIHHHVNVSGLLYVPQALELEQKGLKIEAPERHVEEDDEHPRRHGRSREDEEECEEDDEDHRARARSREEDEDEPPCPEARRIPSWQYVNGAVLVRDGFYLEARHPGGITLLVNDPASYSQIRLAARPGQVAGFRPAIPPPPGSDEGGTVPPPAIPPPLPREDGQTPSAGGIPAPSQWVEIRPLLP